MFGQHKRKREKRRHRREQAQMQAEIDRLKQDQGDQTSYQQQVNENIEREKEREKQAREEGRKYQEEFFKRDWEGLTPEEMQRKQEYANTQLDKEMQGYNRKLISQQGRRGVQGGAAYAQQADLARVGEEASQMMYRDLLELDEKIRAQKMAAAYNMEQGEMSQDLARRQMAIDELNAYDQRKYQKWLAQESSKLFERV